MRAARNTGLIPENKKNVLIQSWFRTRTIYYQNTTTSSNGNIFRVTGLCHRSPIVSPHKGQGRGTYVFYLRLDKRSSKQSRRRWFETPSHPLWRHCKSHMVGTLSFPWYCINYSGTMAAEIVLSISITYPHAWWCHGMETSPKLTLLNLLRWIPPEKGQQCGALVFPSLLAWTRGLTKSGCRCYDAHVHENM